MSLEKQKNIEVAKKPANYKYMNKAQKEGREFVDAVDSEFKRKLPGKKKTPLKKEESKSSAAAEHKVNKVSIRGAGVKDKVRSLLYIIRDLEYRTSQRKTGNRQAQNLIDSLKKQAEFYKEFIRKYSLEIGGRYKFKEEDFIVLPKKKKILSPEEEARLAENRTKALEVLAAARVKRGVTASSSKKITMDTKDDYLKAIARLQNEMEAMEADIAAKNRKENEEAEEKAKQERLAFDESEGKRGFTR